MTTHVDLVLSANDPIVTSAADLEGRDPGRIFRFVEDEEHVMLGLVLSSHPIVKQRKLHQAPSHNAVLAVSAIQEPSGPRTYRRRQTTTPKQLRR
jgi:hypothetical protein